MMAVALSERETLIHLQNLKLTSAVSIGCINSPCSTTVTGSHRGIEQFQLFLEATSIFTRKLRTNVAYHSPRMDSIATAYKEKLDATVSWANPWKVQGVKSRIFSSVTGQEIHPSELNDARYWVKNLVSKVDFCIALASLAKAHKTSLGTDISRSLVDQPLFVEIGPHAALERPIKETLKDALKTVNPRYISAMRRNTHCNRTILTLVGFLFCQGYKLDLTSVNESDSKTHQHIMMVDLPPYPFSREGQYWRESRLSKEFRFRTHRRHELLGTRARDWNSSEATWRNVLRTTDLPWISEYKVCTAVRFVVGVLISAGKWLFSISSEWNDLRRCRSSAATL